MGGFWSIEDHPLYDKKVPKPKATRMRVIDAPKDRVITTDPKPTKIEYRDDTLEITPPNFTVYLEK